MESTDSGEFFRVRCLHQGGHANECDFTRNLPCLPAQREIVSTTCRIASQNCHLSNFQVIFSLRTQRRYEPSKSEVDLSATQVLLATATGLGVTGPLIWLFVRYWLFAP